MVIIISSCVLLCICIVLVILLMTMKYIGFLLEVRRVCSLCYEDLERHKINDSYTQWRTEFHRPSRNRLSACRESREYNPVRDSRRLYLQRRRSPRSPSSRAGHSGSLETVNAKGHLICVGRMFASTIRNGKPKRTFYVGGRVNNEIGLELICSEDLFLPIGSNEMHSFLSGIYAQIS